MLVVQCAHCRSEIKRKPSDAAKARHHFCDRQCKGAWQSLNKRDLAARFEQYVKKSRGCWEWGGGIRKDGYGQIAIDGHQALTHRVSWSLAFGVIPSGMCVLHRCDNRRCVKPSHLWLGSKGDNNRDREAKGRGNHASGEAHGRHTKPERTARGERQGSAKLTVDIVRRVRLSYKRGVRGYREVAREFNILWPTVKDVVTRRSWKHI